VKEEDMIERSFNIPSRRREERVQPFVGRET